MTAVPMPAAPRPPEALTVDELIDRVAVFETLESLDRDRFEEYTGVETVLENRLLQEANRLAAACEHAQAAEILDMVIELNETMRRAAKREYKRVGQGSPDAEYFAFCRDAAAGLILLAEGQKQTTIAEQHRILGDLDTGLSCLRNAMEQFRSLAESNYPNAEVGDLLGSVATVSARLYESQAQSRVGNYRGAHDLLDSVRANVEELLAIAAESDFGDGPLRAVLMEMTHSLTSSLVDITALQGFVDMMMAGHAGRFRDMIVIGADALGSYEASLQAASASSAGRHVLALRRMEMDAVSFWIDLAKAEVAVDDARWLDATEAIRTARRHLAEVSRLGVRNQEVGLTAQRPDVSTLEFLLAGIERRAERERGLRQTGEELRSSLHRAHLSSINVYNSAEARGGKNVVGDKFEFNAPVQNNGNLGGSGNHSSVSQAQQNTGASGTELRKLADQLADLREVLEAGPRSPQERESIEEVREAEVAARAGDEEGVRGHLARAGGWVLGVAERIGVELATTALRQSIGA